MSSTNSPSEKTEYGRHDSHESLSGDHATEQQMLRNLLFKLDTRSGSHPPESNSSTVDRPLTWDVLPSRLLPILAILFLCSFLDRTNVGNAKVLGFEEDINISNNQYDIGLTVYYLTYVCRYD